MAKMLDGKVAIVTGAGRGIGRGEALLLAKYGAKVVVNDPGVGLDGKGKDVMVADSVVQEIKSFGGEAVANYESVTDFNGAKKLVDQAINTYGKLDILVNNAGILRDRMIFNMSEEDWDIVIGVNLKGTFNCTRHACAYWRELHKAGKPISGRIISTSSDAGLLYNPGQSNYGAAKAGVTAFTLIVAKEMARYGVTANVVAPMARTRLTTDATPSLAPLMGTPESMKEKFGYDILDPENIAPLVVYLASDEAKDITGQVFRIAGGYIWIFDSWRTVARIDKRGRWTPEEISAKIKELLSKLPPRPDIASTMKEVGLV
ncbi:MAG: SDR family oxidoreductase [Candidatus Bathyarchaeota archaeon]